MLSSNLLKSNIPICGRGGWGGGFVEFDVEFKFAKIQNSHLCVCGGGGGGLAEFDVEFKFAKIQNSHLWGVGVSWNLMLSSNLLKSKIPICGRGGGIGGTNFQLLMLSPNLLKKKKKIFFVKNFLSFWAKMCLGMVFDFEYRVVRYTKYSESQQLITANFLLVTVHILCMNYPNKLFYNSFITPLKSYHN